MTVTYRTARPQSFSGRCPDCATSCDVEVEGGATIVIRVTGRTCPHCNPGGGGTGGSDPVPQRTITIGQSREPGARPRVRTLVTDSTGRAERVLAERDHPAPVLVSGPEAESTAAAWRTVAEPLVAERLGAGNWELISKSWRPSDCASMDTVAAALDEAWATAVPGAGGTTLIVDLGGIPAVPAQMMAATVTGWLSTRHGGSIAALGERLRALGTLCCAGSGIAAWCAPLPDVLGHGALDPPAPAELAAIVRAVPEMTSVDLPARVLRARPAVPDPPPDPPVGPVALVTTTGLLDRTQQTPAVSTTFGCR
ncbi:hypothetical protein Acy02nite_26620 [Actinoplanes cyaneus]|uniref:Uncharacterized protein n=1 Tax=Actinoplanes cyaneus TaxID=52696 RepID=A0A919IHZ9_9ACTN|nr:hypothetical protein [Actinoplanes cyaneus]MCW2138011.1 hypothetical protein [Actinoplanes cyaneus]GID64781.1 hypothetical protein Acy02nite_26620 [Actinoplanes cyaneus]